MEVDFKNLKFNNEFNDNGGRGEISNSREPSRAPPVFKTGALNHSATLPLLHFQLDRAVDSERLAT